MSSASASPGTESRKETWQHKESKEDDSRQTWTEFGVQTAVGFVPVVGPITNACWNTYRGRYFSAAFDVGSAALDAVTWGAWALGRTSATATVKLTQTGGDLLVKSTKIVTEDAAQVITQKVVESATKQVTSKVVKVTVETIAEEALEQCAKKLAKDLIKEGLGREAAEEAAKYAVKLIAEHAADLGADAFQQLLVQQVPGLLARFAEGAARTIESPFQLTEEHASNDGGGSNQQKPDMQQVNGMINITIKPCRPLRSSNFLRLYDACPKTPSSADIQAALPAEAEKLFTRFLRASWGDVGKAAATLWTDDRVKAFRPINAALISDNEGLLRIWVPLIRVLNNYLLRCSPSPMTVRRKSRMTRAEALALRVGQSYRMGMYVATTRCTGSLPEGVGGDEVVIEFIVPKGCLQTRYIADASLFRSEKEVLIVPYSPASVVDRHDPGPGTGPVRLKMELYQDSLGLPLDWPTAIV